MNKNTINLKKEIVLEIKPQYFCNDDCIICDFHDKKRLKSMSFYELIKNIDFFSENFDIKEIVISGGEATIRTDFLNILVFIKNKKISSTYLHTNAIKLSDFVFAKKTLKYISRIMVGLHADTSELYGKISKFKNFEKKMEGINNILYLKTPIRTNTVIIKQNVKYLHKISAKILDIGVKKVLFTYPFIMGGAKINFNEIVITDLKLIQTYLFPSIDLLLEEGVIVNLQGFPPCFFNGNEYSKLEEVWNERILVDVEHQFTDHINLFNDLIEKNLYCNYCSLRNKCILRNNL